MLMNFYQLGLPYQVRTISHTRVGQYWTATRERRGSGWNKSKSNMKTPGFHNLSDQVRLSLKFSSLTILAVTIYRTIIMKQLLLIR